MMQCFHVKKVFIHTFAAHQFRNTLPTSTQGGQKADVYPCNGQVCERIQVSTFHYSSLINPFYSVNNNFNLIPYLLHFSIRERFLNLPISVRRLSTRLASRSLRTRAKRRRKKTMERKTIEECELSAIVGRAQLGEHQTLRVAGSSPASGSLCYLIFKMIRL